MRKFFVLLLALLLVAAWSCAYAVGSASEGNVEASASLSISGEYCEGSVGVPYSCPVTVAGGKKPYEWYLPEGSFPDGLEGWYYTATGMNDWLVGTPTRAGTFNFTVSVYDADGKSIRKACSIQINPAPEIKASLPTTCTVGQPYSGTLTASGGNGNFTWSIEEGSSLPPGILLEGSNTIASISGTPTKAGTYTVKVKLSFRQKYFTQYVNAFGDYATENDIDIEESEYYTITVRDSGSPATDDTPSNGDTPSDTPSNDGDTNNGNDSGQGSDQNSQGDHNNNTQFNVGSGGCDSGIGLIGIALLMFFRRSR